MKEFFKITRLNINLVSKPFNSLEGAQREARRFAKTVENTRLAMCVRYHEKDHTVSDPLHTGRYGVKRRGIQLHLPTNRLTITWVNQAYYEPLGRRRTHKELRQIASAVDKQSIDDWLISLFPWRFRQTEHTDDDTST